MYIRVPTPHTLGESMFSHIGALADPPIDIDIEFDEFLKTVDRDNFVKVLEELRKTLNGWVGDYGPSIGQIIIRRALQFLDLASLTANSDPGSSNRNRSLEYIKTAFDVLGFVKLILAVEVTLKILMDIVVVTIPAGFPTKLLRIGALAVTVAQVTASSKKLKDILTALSTILLAVKTLETLKRARSFYVANRDTIVTLSNPSP